MGLQLFRKRKSCSSEEKKSAATPTSPERNNPGWKASVET